jgi:hypothetical protein
MKIAAIVPHLLQFGGIRRFLELGNVFAARGCDYTVYARKPKFSSWFDYRGNLSDWAKIDADIVLIADPPCFPILQHINSPVYVWVIAGGHYVRQYRELSSRYPFLVNNRTFLKEFPDARLVEGGVNVERFYPSKLVVGYYAGRGWTKGEEDIVGMLGDLPDIKLLPIKGWADLQLPEVYRSLDYFVTWEKRTGWSNTAAEALACGIPVVTNGMNCEPFSNLVIKTSDLRAFFSKPMAEFSWEAVADKLEEIWKYDGVWVGG